MVMKSQQAHRRHRMFLTAGTALRFPRQERIAFNCSIRKAMVVGGVSVWWDIPLSPSCIRVICRCCLGGMGGDRCVPDVSTSSAEWSLGAGEVPHPLQTWVLGPPTSTWQPPQPGNKRQTFLGWENVENPPRFHKTGAGDG